MEEALKKTIMFRIIASLSTVIITFLFTWRIEVGIGVGAVVTVVNFILYYLFEKWWNREEENYVEENEDGFWRAG